MNPVYEKLLRCYESVKEKVDFKPKAALILGSGLGEYIQEMKVVQTLDYSQIQGFPCQQCLVIRVALFSDMWGMCL